jgi:hypothetical protein
VLNEDNVGKFVNLLDSVEGKNLNPLHLMRAGSLKNDCVWVLMGNLQ